MAAMIDRDTAARAAQRHTTQTKHNMKPAMQCAAPKTHNTTQTNIKSATAAMIERDISHGSAVKNTVKNAA